MRVTEVWFLQKKDKGDGFEDFLYDYTTKTVEVEVIVSLSQ
jgi:hypothetical protein